MEKRFLAGPVSAGDHGAVPGHARLLRPGADHRPLQQPAGGQLRERLRRQVPQRVLRQPGDAGGAAGGVSARREARLRQRPEPGRPVLPPRPGPGRERRADGDPRPARFRDALQAILLPEPGRRGLLPEPLCLDGPHRPRAGDDPPGLRPGHAGGEPGRERLPPDDRRQPPPAPPRDRRPDRQVLPVRRWT